MSEQKFTPGPWRVDRHLGTIVGPDGGPIAGEANYTLAAAAPDLLEALQVVLKIIERHVGTSTAAIEGTPIFMARAAIAKATGSQS